MILRRTFEDRYKAVASIGSSNVCYNVTLIVSPWIWPFVDPCAWVKNTTLRWRILCNSTRRKSIITMMSSKYSFFFTHQCKDTFIVTFESNYLVRRTRMKALGKAKATVQQRQLNNENSEKDYNHAAEKKDAELVQALLTHPTVCKRDLGFLW